MSAIRVVLYLNQFFAGQGAEAQAGIGPGKKIGAVGPGIALQHALGERAQIVATVYCGDNYANERANAIDEILERVSEERPDILIAGPAFVSGRYGLACGALCARAQNALGIVAVTGMHPDNPGADLYRTKVHIARTRESAAGVAEAVKLMARLALKLYDREPLGTPQEEGYIPTGRRVHFVAEQTAAKRAVDMLIKKISGQPYTTEWPVPSYSQVTPAPPLKDIAHAKIALVTTGGVVPRGNPDRLESAYASKWLKYQIGELNDLKPSDWQSIHGGFDTTNVNEDPDRMAPLDALRELEHEGAFKDLADELYTTTGNTAAIPTVRRFAQEMLKELRANDVQGVILTSA
ncbi:MAG: glycine/betaine/sarcosine/D-proline family reductase selenoprotein B [Deltaproteobacteria bacterium]|nr:glycine/betaine/sarcosine/D-proline family reductase selenoprotein B [Deltaproteobacteria bacterium]